MRYLTLVFSFLALFAMQGVVEAANPCNPCGMKANPCAMEHVKKMNARNPCGMKANPCSVDASTPIRAHAFNSFQEAVSLGERMWSDDKGMGKAGVACLSCHADFELLNLGKNQNFPHYVKMVGDVVTLDQMINYCLLNPMKGKQLESNSKELTAMAAYYRAYRMKYMRKHRK